MQKWTCRSSFALLLFSLLALSASAVQPDRRISQYAHTAWRIRDGIFGSSPNSITQTADGYLWIGTENGLVRFDGVRFQPWTPPPGETIDSRVFSVLGTRDGALWVGTGRGLSRVTNGHVKNFETGSRINVMFEDGDGVWIARSRARDGRGPICHVDDRGMQCRGKSDGLSMETAGQIVRDRENGVWFGGSSGLSLWAEGKVTNFFEEEFTEEKIFGLNALAASADGSVWACLEHEPPAVLRRYLHGAWTMLTPPRIDEKDIEISGLFIDREQSLWIATMGHGLLRYARGVFDHFSMADGLTSNDVRAFHQDHEGNLWVTTSQGIDMFRDARVVSYSVREGLIADSVSSVAGSVDGRVWIGNVGALDVLQGETVASIRPQQGFPGRVITSMYADHAGRVWVGVDRGLWVYEQGKFREIKRIDGNAVGRVLAITEDSDHTIWLQGGQGFLQVRDEKVSDVPALQDVVGYALVPDPKEGIWLGMRDGELARLRGDALERFPAAPDAKQGSVMGVAADADGSVWAAVRQGLIRLVGKERKLLGVRNGLPCEFYYGLVQDNHGAVWMYGQCGLVSIARAELMKWWARPDTVVQVNLFDMLDGAEPGMATFQPSATKTPDGRLWFANDRVVQMIDPDRLQKNGKPPPVHIERVVADRREYAPQQDLVLPALTRDLEIDYTALSFAAPQKVRFRYQLEGRDSNWQDPETRRQAFYTDLRPGPYTFRVIACNQDGVWNESGAMLRFRIAAAWYQTNWFRALAIFLALVVAWTLYRLRVRQIRRNLSARFDERLAERTRIARELHDTMLQTIQASKMVADTQGNEQLSTWLGQAVEEGRAALNSLRSSTTQENDLARAFRIAAEQCPKPDAMDIGFIVHGTPLDMHPIVRDEICRIGDEAIRNACMHSHATQMTIELRYEKDVILRIADNGVGIDDNVVTQGKEGHFGLQGMRERAERIGATFTLVSTPAGGTAITLVVPGKVVFR
jgi:ligand-binding sensor domain-containing protein